MHHLSLYFHFVKLRIRSQMEYRLSFVFDLFAQASVSVIDFFMIALLFNRFKQLAGLESMGSWVPLRHDWYLFCCSRDDWKRV